MLLLQHPSSSSKPRGGSPAMVVTWFSELRRSLTNPENHHHHHHYLNQQHNHSRWINSQEKPETLGILAFDTAKTIARLISLYKSLSDDEFLRLRKHVMRGKGISYLTSEDEGFLLTLACSERLEDLDRAASAVARLGHKCSDYGLVRFDQVYKDLKNGYVDLEKLASYGSKEMEKCIDKMERLATQTGNLYAELESLSELEVSERRLCEWKKRDSVNNNGNTNYDLFDHKLLNQRKLVRQLKEVSLWSQSHDKIVGLMAKMVCVLYARICALFGPYISILPSKKGCFGGPLNNNTNNNKKQRKILTPEMSQKLFSDPSPHTTMSGPLTSPSPRVPLVRFLSRESPMSITGHVVGATNNKVFQAAPPSTVGGSGLAVRYANVILLSLRYLNTESLIGDQARHNLYNMLPMSLKTYVRTKLRAAWREAEEEDNGGGDALAEGWREAVKGILEWLAPMAEDTLTWQTERNMEKQKFDAKPTVLLLQTLHYADLEKTEAAIAEVLVGLSCIYWYENRRLSCVDIY